LFLKKNYFLRYWPIYSMILPGIAYFIIFQYIPLFGSVIAFQKYNIFSGIWGSEWVGFDNFRIMLEHPNFYRIIRNTLVIAFYKLVLGFPAPILLALLLNEVRQRYFKRFIQTFLYLPHFLSWVIVGGIVINILSPTTGMVNEVIKLFGEKPIFFMQMPEYFRSIVVVSDIWRSVGWGTIIYLAALAGVNMELYESAEVDGASRLRQTISITLPAIMPTIIVLLLINIGDFLNLGAEQLLVLQNPLVLEVGDIIDTYVYRVGLLGGQFSQTAAVGMFKSVIGFILIIGANRLAKLTTGNSIY